MFNSGKKNILTLVLSEEKFLNKTKNHNPPPFKLNGRSLMSIIERLKHQLYNICMKN